MVQNTYYFATRKKNVTNEHDLICSFAPFKKKSGNLAVINVINKREIRSSKISLDVCLYTEMSLDKN
jgi:hypothetical protein